MRLVDVVLDDGEFLNGPLSYVDEGLHFCSCVAVKTLNRFLKLVLELAIVAVDESKDVNDFSEALSDTVWPLGTLEL